jgi:hypothetical protein
MTCTLHLLDAAALSFKLHNSTAHVHLQCDLLHSPLLLPRPCSKYDKSNKGGLSWEDIQAMILGNMNIVDPVGW